MFYLSQPITGFITKPSQLFSGRVSASKTPLLETVSISRTLSIFQLLNLYAKTTGIVCANGIKAVKKSDKPGFTKETNIAITNKIRPENEIIFLPS